LAEIAAANFRSVPAMCISTIPSRRRPSPDWIWRGRAEPGWRDSSGSRGLDASSPSCGRRIRRLSGHSRRWVTGDAAGCA